MEDDSFQQMFDQVNKMRQEIDRIKAGLRRKIIQVESGPVRLEMNGYQEVTGVWFRRGAAADDALEEAVKTAVNEAISKSRSVVMEEMGKVMGGFVPPGFGSIFD